MFIAVLFTITKTRKQLKCQLTGECIKKWQHIYLMRYYSIIKKKEILAFTIARMALEGIMLTDISQIKKDKTCIISLLCGL